MTNIFYKIRRYFNPTFGEWLEDMKSGLNKEMQKPEWTSHNAPKEKQE